MTELSQIQAVDISPTLSTSAYADGDVMGTKQTISRVASIGRKAIFIDNVTVIDVDEEGADFDIVLFGSDPSASTFTDNAAEAIVDADAKKIVAIIPIVAANYTALANATVAVKAVQRYIALPNAGTSIYAVLVSRDTPTFAAATNLKITLNVGAG